MAPTGLERTQDMHTSHLAGGATRRRSTPARLLFYNRQACVPRVSLALNPFPASRSRSHTLTERSAHEVTRPQVFSLTPTPPSPSHTRPPTLHCRCAHSQLPRNSLHYFTRLSCSLAFLLALRVRQGLVRFIDVVSTLKGHLRRLFTSNLVLNHPHAKQREQGPRPGHFSSSSSSIHLAPQISQRTKVGRNTSSAAPTANTAFFPPPSMPSRNREVCVCCQCL